MPDLRKPFAFIRREIGVLTILFVVALLVRVFLHIAEEMGECDTRAFDTSVLLALRTGDHHEPIGGILPGRRCCVRRQPDRFSLAVKG